MSQLVTVQIDVTPKQRAALMLACKRLGLSFAELQQQIKGVCQDAATRKVCQLSKAGQHEGEQREGYPDCGKCWVMRAETCARCGTATLTEPAEYELIGCGVVNYRVR